MDYVEDEIYDIEDIEDSDYDIRLRHELDDDVTELGYADYDIRLGHELDEIDGYDIRLRGEL